jgi:hypothetical protein
MKLLVLLAFLIFIACIVYLVTSAVKNWRIKQVPWSLIQEESEDGLRYRLCMVKPGQPKEVMTPWLWIKDKNEISHFITREEAQQAVDERNLLPRHT